MVVGKKKTFLAPNHRVHQMYYSVWELAWARSVSLDEVLVFSLIFLFQSFSALLTNMQKESFINSQMVPEPKKKIKTPLI